MRTIYLIALFLLLLSGLDNKVSAQNCQNGTPLFYVNLSGQPNGVWQSPPILRDGDCCGASDFNCIEFILTLDSNATGILFNITAGAMPGGALFYQVNCGPLQTVGVPVCLDGPGPHDITFCKPGNNLNVYEIQSIPIPEVTGTEWVTEACLGYMSILGLDSSTTVWSSVPPNPTYNSWLSCISGCNTVTVTPSGPVPPYVDYQVCGYPTGGCYTTPFCDTMRVNFANSLAVSITPQNPVICFGQGTATVTANSSGGLMPYNYVWSTGSTTQSITVGSGTFYVTLTDSMNCSIATDSVVVSALSATITANAGPDQILCTNDQTAPLNGAVIAATGGIWSGGNGFFNPNNTTLNATYTPSPLEVSNGSVTLTLTTTGNSGCPGDTDQVVISISPNPAPIIAGNNIPCASSTGVYSVPFVAGNTYNWSVTGGIIASTNINNATVVWGTTGNGSITVTQTNVLGCDSTVTLPVQIVPQPAPVINGPLAVCTTTSIQYSVANPVPGNTYTWNVIGAAITGPSNNSSVLVTFNGSGTAVISVTEANSFGCDSTVSITASVLTMPAPVISGPDTVCAGQSVVYSTPFVTGNIYNWNVTGGTIVSSSNNSVIITWPVAGAGMVTVTEINTVTCDSTVTLNINVAPQPAPAISGPPVNCTTYSSQYRVVNFVAVNTYLWSVVGGTIIGPNNLNIVDVMWSAAGTASISLIESNPLGCDSLVSITTTTLVQPTPSLAGPDTVCAGHTYTYTTPFVTGNNYTWNVAGGNIISLNNNTINVQWPVPGNGTVTITESNTSTCDSTIAIPIVVAGQPVPAITGPPVVCTSYINTYSVVNPLPGNTYNWSINGGTITGPANGTSINVQWQVPGTATISLTEANSLGCDSTVTLTATILTIPAPVLNGPDSVCQYGSITYSVPLIQSNTYTWNVTGGSVLSINNNSITVQWPFTGNGTIAVTESNTSNCDSTVSMEIFINPQPTPVITGNNVSCTSTFGQYSLQSIIPGNTYTWNVTGGTIQGSPTASSINVLWTTAGNGSVTVTETNSYCDSTVTYPVLLLQRPAPAVSGPTPVCQMDTVTYSTPFVPNHTYQWTVTNGSIIGLNVGPSIDVLWNNSGAGTVSVRQFSPDGCDSLVSRTITVNPIPLPVINGPASICENEPAIYSVGLSPGNTYNWTITGGIINGPSTGTQISVQWNNVTTGSVNITQTSSLGCRNTDYNTVTILEKPEPHIYGSSVGCLLTPGTYYSNTEPGTYYQWNVTGGTITSGNGTSYVNIVWTTIGSQTITLTATDSISGCDSTITMNVVTGTMPTAVIQLPSFNGCAPLPASFTGNTENPGIKYNWSFGDGNTSTAANPEYNYPYSGTYNVQLITSNNTGCIDTATTQVTVYPTPVSSFTMYHGTGPYYAGLNTVTFTNTSQGGTTYLWKFGDGTPFSTSFNTEHMYLYPGSYTIQLHVSNQYGCTNISRGILNVIVPEDIYIPNAFSPNGDAHNDQFQVSAININDFDIKIFNRWGQMVYSSTDQHFHWDGTHNGRDIPQGVYVYSLTAVGYHGTRFNLYGTVTLIK